MSQLINSTILAICMNVQGTYNQPCNKALEAGSAQAGFTQQVEMVEKKTLKVVEHKAEVVVGRKGIATVGTGYFIYRSVKEKKLRVNLPKMDLYNSANGEFTRDTYKVNIEWKF